MALQKDREFEAMMEIGKVLAKFGDEEAKLNMALIEKTIEITDTLHEIAEFATDNKAWLKSAVEYLTFADAGASSFLEAMKGGKADV